VARSNRRFRERASIANVQQKHAQQTFRIAKIARPA